MTESLRGQYADKLEGGDLCVFCVSNTLYWDLREASKTVSEPYIILAGVVQLRKHCIAMVSTSQLRESTTFIKDDTMALLSDVQLWVQSGKGGKLAEEKASIRRAVDLIEARLKRVGKLETIRNNQ